MQNSSLFLSPFSFPHTHTRTDIDAVLTQLTRTRFQRHRNKVGSGATNQEAVHNLTVSESALTLLWFDQSLCIFRQCPAPARCCEEFFSLAVRTTYAVRSVRLYATQLLSATYTHTNTPAHKTSTTKWPDVGGNGGWDGSGGSVHLVQLAAPKTVVRVWGRNSWFSYLWTDIPDASCPDPGNDNVLDSICLSVSRSLSSRCIFSRL